MMRKFSAGALCSQIFLWVCGTLVSAAERSFATWSQYLGGADSSQYSSLKQINKSNVKQLEVAWTYQTGPGTYTFDPVVVDGVMYVSGAEVIPWSRWMPPLESNCGFIPTWAR